MASRVLYSNGELVTEDGTHIDAQSLVGPQSAAITDVGAVAAVTSAAASGGDSPTEGEFNAAQTDIVNLRAAAAANRTAINSILAALRANGTIAT